MPSETFYDPELGSIEVVMPDTTEEDADRIAADLKNKIDFVEGK